MTASQKKITQRLSECIRPTGEEDMLSVRYPRARVSLTMKSALCGLCALITVVLIVVVIACITGVWGREDSVGEAHTAVNMYAQSQQGRSASLSASSVPPAEDTLVVAVYGHVEHPGVVEVSAGARVIDALDRAVPFPEADIASLNPARKVSDGELLYVALPGEVPPAVSSLRSGTHNSEESDPVSRPGGGAAPSGSVSLNTASTEELTALPGVGPKTAAAIVQYRENNGAFTSIDQLEDVKGIGTKTVEKLRPFVTL